jgi:hypothetical protein
VAQQKSSFKRLRLVVVGSCLACLTVSVACAQEKNQELKKATDWLKSTMEKYGEYEDGSGVFKISNVKFDRCSMQWMESRWQQGRDPGEKFLIETTYRVQLGDLNPNGYDGVSKVEGIDGATSGLDFVRIRNPGGEQKIQAEEHIYFTDLKGTKREQKGEGRTRSEGMITVPIKNEVKSKFIETLDRAVKLCGGTPKNE